ncbi:MAG: hypothetical protein LUD72_07000 [Bacteroidales bacterium]|nr:hypothetical protein [Bacteroidales bacterium]
MKKETMDRMIFLLNKVAKINERTDYKATFNYGKDSLGIYVEDSTDAHESVMCEFIYGELTEEKTYQLYIALDNIEFSDSKLEADTTDEG